MKDLTESTDNKEIETKDTFQAKIRNLKSKIEKARVLLWDIDGTLIRSAKHGAFKEYFVPALERVYGSSGKLADLKVSGMTDTQIAYESLKDEGFTPEQILGERENLLRIFKEEMTRVVGNKGDNYIILPGIPEMLEATSKEPQFLNALLTGNLSCAAEIKLRSVDLWKYFENSPNIFGEISHDRRELARHALPKINEFLEREVKPEQIIVIGDTPNDIACARAVGAKIVSVTTGRNHPREELSQYNPDVLLDDLSDTKKVLEILAEL